MTVVTFALFFFLAWLSLLARKLRRLTHQRGLHFERLVKAIDGGASAHPPYDPNDPASLVALATKEIPTGHNDEVRQARWLFNEATLAINVRVETIPTGWFAKAMGYRALPYFTPSLPRK